MKKRVVKKSIQTQAVSQIPSVEFDVLNEKIDRVIEVMVTKDELQDELTILRKEMTTNFDGFHKENNERFREVLLAIEGLMTPISELKMEYVGVVHQLNRHEKWIHILAQKQGTQIS